MFGVSNCGSSQRGDSEATPSNPTVYPITMTATDAGGAIASRTFNLTVQDVPN